MNTLVGSLLEACIDELEARFCVAGVLDVVLLFTTVFGAGVVVVAVGVGFPCIVAVALADVVAMVFPFVGAGVVAKGRFFWIVTGFGAILPDFVGTCLFCLPPPPFVVAQTFVFALGG